MVSKNDPYFSKTIEKGLILLNLFDRDHPRRSLSEISRLTGINKTSVFRFVNTLVKLGYLKKSESNKLLKLGPRALLLGHNFTQGFDLLQGVKPIIDKNFLECKNTIDSALLYDLTLLSLYRRDAPNPIYFRLPLVFDNLYARAMGKAVLAQLSQAERLRFLDSVPRIKHTANTLTKREDILADIKATEERGYAINNEENVPGLICIGAALMNYKTKTVVGAVSIDFSIAEHSLSSIEQNYTGMLTKLASDISEMITRADN